MTDLEIIHKLSIFEKKLKGDSLEEIAGKSLLERVNYYDSQMNSIDIDKMQIIYKNGIENLNKLYGDELSKLVEVENTINQYKENFIQRNEHILTIIALDIFMEGLDRSYIIKHFCDEPIEIQNQILIRFAWIQRHHEIIKLGQHVEDAYMCIVPDPSCRKTADREFYTILHFLNSYNSSTSKSALFNCSYPQDKQPPDFSAISKDSGLFGIEITELPFSKEYNDEIIANEKIQKKIYSKFKSYPFIVTIWSRPSWQTLLKEENVLIQWIEQIFSSFKEKNDVELWAENNNLGYKIELRKNLNQLVFFDMSPTGYEYGNKCEEELSTQAIQRIEKKLNGRKSPLIRPCFLVFYINGAHLFKNVDYFIKTTGNKLKINYKNNFDEIWFLNGSKAFSLNS